jgi:CheY-like chemotaxis protein
MTADVSAACREQCLAAGMDDYIPKPVTLDNLTAALQKVLPSAIPTAHLV